MPFTRLWCVERFFDSLEASDVPLERCKIVCYVDSDDQGLVDEVTRRTAALPCPDALVHCSAWEPPAERCRVRIRRARHAFMRMASVALIPDAKYLLLLEDDTTVPVNTWERMMAAFDAGYEWICGYEVGRWSCRCPGIWRIEGEVVQSATPGEGLEECDATGLYLVLTTPEVYRSARWDVWDNSYGHDVSITYGMKRNGVRLGVDWSLKCIHMTEQGDLYPDTWERFVRKVEGFNPVLLEHPLIEPYTEFPAAGPKRRRHKHEYVYDMSGAGKRRSPRMVVEEKLPPKMNARGTSCRLRSDFEYEGRTYSAGTKLSLNEAREMGLL